MKNWLKNTLIVLLSLGIIICLFVIGTTELDSKETSLMGIILSLFSIISSYLISQHFSEISHKSAIEEVKDQHRENLRTYALNAAEKVDNLSKELTRLANYLEEETVPQDDRIEVELLSKTEKINSAIHLISTLKNVNDTYLSDWRGVIPDELEEIDEEKEEKAEELKSLIRSVELILSKQSNSPELSANQQIINEIEELKNDIVVATRNLGNVRIRSTKKVRRKPTKENVSVNCPKCEHPIEYRQRPMANSHKPVTCSSCGTKCTARWYEDQGFKLEKNQLKEEVILCPYCNTSYNEMVDTSIYSRQQSECKNCNRTVKLTRNTNGVKVAKLSIDTSRPSDTDMLIKVKDLLPTQPWPKEIHKTIASELNVANSQVSSAINTLMQRGDVYPQINGVVYYPEQKKDELPEDIASKS